MIEPLPYRDPEQLADDQAAGDEYQAELLEKYIEKHWPHFVDAVVEAGLCLCKSEITQKDIEYYIKNDKSERAAAIKVGALEDRII